MHGRGSVNDNPVKQTKKRKIFWSIISHYRHSKHSNRQSISNWKGGHFYSCCSSPRWNASSRVSLQLQQKFKKPEKPQVLFESLFYVEMRQNTRSEYLWILGIWSHDQKQQTKHMKATTHRLNIGCSNINECFWWEDMEAWLCEQCHRISKLWIIMHTLQ